MIIGIEGGLSSGKTLVMTWLMLQEYLELQKPLFANYHFRQVPFTLIDVEWLVEAQKENFHFDRAAIGLDEMHILADSRSGMTKRNKLVSYFLLQTAKEGINLYYTTQSFKQVDIRLRQRTDFAISVDKRADLHRCTMIDQTQPDFKVSKFGVYGPDVYEHYYTKEVIRQA